MNVRESRLDVLSQHQARLPVHYLKSNFYQHRLTILLSFLRLSFRCHRGPVKVFYCPFLVIVHLFQLFPMVLLNLEISYSDWQLWTRREKPCYRQT